MNFVIKTIISCIVAGLVAIAAVWYHSIYTNEADIYVNSGLSDEGIFFFKSLDVNEDGFLSPHEVAPLIEKFTGQSTTSFSWPKYDEPGELITLKADFKPLDFSSLRNDDLNIHGVFGSHTVWKSLRNWTTPTMTEKSFNTIDFSTFLPPLKKPELGQAWRIHDPPDFDYKNNRFFPPVPHPRVALLSEMLRMFHPRPFMDIRFKPRGTVAVVRAQNDQFFDIAFRFHAEFQISEPPNLPFWFTPAQFAGNLVISRDGRHIEYFQFYVPSDKKLNIDMEWLTNSTNEFDMEVEIGYLPQLELKSTAPSTPPDNEEEVISDNEEEANNSDQSRIVWQEEITREQANLELEKVMYPFKQVTYHDFDKVFDHAKAENKLVHNIVLWGALDDQSC